MRDHCTRTFGEHVNTGNTRARSGYKGIHALRHYCGTTLSKSSGIENASRVLGHASIATTSSYVKTDMDSLVAAVKHLQIGRVSSST